MLTESEIRNAFVATTFSFPVPGSWSELEKFARHVEALVEKKLGYERVDTSNAAASAFESDPYDLHPHTPGAKLDANKPNCDLVFSNLSNALLEVAKVGTAGALKYTDNGWESVPDGIRRYRSAIYRHLLSSKFLDRDSGMPHMAHAAWNCLAVLELLLRTENNNTGI